MDAVDAVEEGEVEDDKVVEVDKPRQCWTKAYRVGGATSFGSSVPEVINVGLPAF